MKRITQRIRAALARRRHWRRVLENRNANERDLLRALRKTKRRIAARRALRKTLGGGTRERRERLADKIEALLAYRDALLERLDRLERKQKRARRQLRRHRLLVERLRKRRRAIAAQREGQLTPNFHVREFDCRDGTKVPEAAIPALKKWCENIGEPVRKRGGAVHVTSGYRTRSYNASVGGATNSVHIYDAHPGAVAVDHTCSGLSPSGVAAFEDPLPETGGLGRYSTFTHADNRQRIGWPRARWWG